MVNRVGESYSGLQRSGSEYGGVAHTPSGIQPQSSEAFTNTDRLRLGYTTGEEENWMSIEDRRQFYGLRPATGHRPVWLGGVSSEGDPRLDSVASMAQEIQFDIDADSVEIVTEADTDITWDDDV